MSPAPRFQTEFMIRQNIAEIEAFAEVFRQRIVTAFAAIAAAYRGEVTAEVTSAHPLNDDQLAALAAKLQAREGRAVKLSARVDPELLGGLVVRIGSQQIDSSIRTRLNSLALAMKG